MVPSDSTTSYQRPHSLLKPPSNYYSHLQTWPCISWKDRPYHAGHPLIFPPPNPQAVWTCAIFTTSPPMTVIKLSLLMGTLTSATSTWIPFSLTSKILALSIHHLSLLGHSAESPALKQSNPLLTPLPHPFLFSTSKPNFSGIPTFSVSSLTSSSGFNPFRSSFHPHHTAATAFLVSYGCDFAKSTSHSCVIVQHLLP